MPIKDNYNYQDYVKDVENGDFGGLGDNGALDDGLAKAAYDTPMDVFEYNDSYDSYNDYDFK